MSHLFPTGVIKPTKLISFLRKKKKEKKEKKQVHEFIRVKVVTILNFRYEKVDFILFYVKDVNKTVP